MMMPFCTATPKRAMKQVVVKGGILLND
jgi:hypothetical protein